MNAINYLKSFSKLVLLGALYITLSSNFVSAQDTLPTYRFDDRNLARPDGTSIVSDPTAFRGNAIFRPSTANSNTFWYGPYSHLQGGNYLIQFRMKVSSNFSDALLLTIDIVSFSGAGRFGSLDIKPNMFRNSNEWQVFTIPVQIPDNINDWEIRGIDFRGGITDISLDYITITPGDARGFYSPEFTVTAKGSVGIGTTDPKDYQLAVNGKIRAHEIKVETAHWPDYVFKPDYQLRSLAELNSFIQTNHRLPEMPSENDVAKDGIALGEMNKLLVKKIEELTLYLIEKDKKEKEQEKRLNQFQLELLDLKKANRK